MLPPLIGGGIERWCCLTSVCLSLAYIGPKSRTERPRKTRWWWAWERIDRGNLLATATSRSALRRRGRLGGARRFGAHRGRRGAGAYCGGRPPFRDKRLMSKMEGKTNFSRRLWHFDGLKGWGLGGAVPSPVGGLGACPQKKNQFCAKIMQFWASFGTSFLYYSRKWGIIQS